MQIAIQVQLRHVSLAHRGALTTLVLLSLLLRSLNHLELILEFRSALALSQNNVDVLVLFFGGARTGLFH